MVRHMVIRIDGKSQPNKWKNDKLTICIERIEMLASFVFATNIYTHLPNLKCTKSGKSLE